MSAIGNTSQKIFTCPACKCDVMVTMALDVEIGDMSLSGVDHHAIVTMTGLSVSHDCIPRVKR